jgi:hypothetical protein
MINLYAYSYPAAINKFSNSGYTLLKLGDSHRDIEVRINEQGNSAEWEEKIIIGSWNNIQKIKRDHDLHEVLTERGLWHSGKHKGTEWFKIPGNTVQDAYNYIDELVAEFEGKRIRKQVKLRSLQRKALNKAMAYIAAGGYDVSIIANLCPRFGKTLWALSLFNEIHNTYGNRVMLLPAYWLSVHSSFINELTDYNDFLDIIQIDVDAEDARERAIDAISAGQRILVPMSLHGDLEEWKAKHAWIASIPNSDVFSFADEGDFGTHTENQIAKLDYIFKTESTPVVGHKFVRVYASGTNVQRLARCSPDIDGVIYTAYSELEQTEPGIIRRKFFCTQVDSLKQEVETLDEKIQPSWIKIWDRPLANKAFVGKLLQSLTGEDSLRPELNLSEMTGETVDCFMLLVSANNKEMKQIYEISEREIPEWHVKVLNGDFTSNRNAEDETKREINEARIAGKKGVVIIANQMGSRSYGIPAIQATVIAYDRGSVDATMQKVSRCLTPATKENLMFNGSTKKDYGYIVDLSFDPNRAENIERLILEEAIQIQRSDEVDFTSAVRYVLTSVDLFKMNEFGYAEEVTEEDMFKILGDNDNLIKVADVAVDVVAAVQSGLFNILANVNASNKPSTSKKAVVGANAINAVTKGSNLGKGGLTDKDKKNIEKIINNAIRSLNMSATSVYDLANGGDSYRGCLELIKDNPSLDTEFQELFGIGAEDAITLVDARALNEAILDVIVQNSKSIDNVFI